MEVNLYREISATVTVLVGVTEEEPEPEPEEDAIDALEAVEAALAE